MHSHLDECDSHSTGRIEAAELLAGLRRIRSIRFAAVAVHVRHQTDAPLHDALALRIHSHALHPRVRHTQLRRLSACPLVAVIAASSLAELSRRPPDTCLPTMAEEVRGARRAQAHTLLRTGGQLADQRLDHRDLAHLVRRLPL